MIYTTEGLPPPPVFVRASSTLASFRPCTPTEVRRIIMNSPVKLCMLDPVPTFMIREFIDLSLPYLTTTVNASLAEGKLPVSEKRAIITPRLMKSGLDPADLANYRPVQSDVHVVAAHELLPRNQSAYRKKHFTESAMLRVWSDILLAADTTDHTPWTSGLVCRISLCRPRPPAAATGSASVCLELYSTGYDRF